MIRFGLLAASAILLLVFFAGCGQPGEGHPMGLTGGGENGYGGGLLSTDAPPDQMATPQTTTAATMNDTEIAWLLENQDKNR